MLAALSRSFGGGPVGRVDLAVAVGEEAETVETVAEPFLVREGMLGRTPRGRVATPATWRHLGLTPPRRTGAQAQLFIDPLELDDDRTGEDDDAPRS